MRPVDASAHVVVAQVLISLHVHAIAQEFDSVHVHMVVHVFTSLHVQAIVQEFMEFQVFVRSVHDKYFSAFSRVILVSHDVR